MAYDDQHGPIRNRLLTALPPGDLARLRPVLNPVELCFDATLHPVGGTVDAVLFPERGMVSLLAAPSPGDLVEVGLAGREGLVGLPLVLGDNSAFVEARVQMAGTALRIEPAAFRAEMARGGALQALLLRYSLAFHVQVALTAACNARHPTNRRLARWLLAAHDRAEMDEFPMTHEFIAAMLGVGRPGVTIAARALQQAGLVRYGRGRVTVADRAGLEAAACGCHSAGQRELARLLGTDPTRRPD